MVRLHHCPGYRRPKRRNIVHSAERRARNLSVKMGSENTAISEAKTFHARNDSFSEVCAMDDLAAILTSRVKTGKFIRNPQQASQLT
ncbi:hypothetical protein Plhal304r1_c046g0127711 [Plasmopara halstedii]